MSVVIDISEAKPADAYELGPLMRQADVVEVRRATGQDPVPAVYQAITMSSRAWTARGYGELICCFGVAPLSLLDGKGTPWLLGTDLIAQYPFEFLGRCREYLDEMQALYPVLDNYVDAENVLSIRFLKWLGFQFSEYPAPYGPERKPFFQFMRVA